METVPGSMVESTNYKMFTEKCPICHTTRTQTIRKAQPSRGTYSSHGRPTKGSVYGRAGKW